MVCKLLFVIIYGNVINRVTMIINVKVTEMTDLLILSPNSAHIYVVLLYQRGVCFCPYLRLQVHL